MVVAGSAAGVVSGAVAIAAGLGFGWKTIGTSLGAAAARVEAPLWGAALDEVIYKRITPSQLIDPVATDSNLARLAEAAFEQIEEHRLQTSAVVPSVHLDRKALRGRLL